MENNRPKIIWRSEIIIYLQPVILAGTKVRQVGVIISTAPLWKLNGCANK